MDSPFHVSLLEICIMFGVRVCVCMCVCHVPRPILPLQEKSVSMW